MAVKLATVIEQKPSQAKKGMYITTLKEPMGEVKSYTPRKLEVGQEVLISVRQGAIRDPLAITVLSAKQEADWKAQNN